MTPAVMTVDQVAEALLVDRKTVYRAIHEGHLYAVKLGRVYRVPTAALEKFLAADTTNEPDGRKREHGVQAT